MEGPAAEEAEAPAPADEEAEKDEGEEAEAQEPEGEDAEAVEPEAGEAEGGEDEEAAEGEEAAAEAKPVTRRRRGSEVTTTPARRATTPAPRTPDGAIAVRASAKYVRGAPRKARLVIDHIRGRPVEQARPLRGGLQPVHDVVILEDLAQRAPSCVLPDHIVRHPFLLRRALEEEREQFSEHAAIVSSAR